MHRTLRPAAYALAALNLLDMAITLLLLAHFGASAEANRLMRLLWEASPLLFVLYKVVLSGAFFGIARRVDGLKQWMAAAVIPAAAIYLVVVGWGVFVLINML